MKTSLEELGITRVEQTHQQAYQGQLQLPDEFDKKRYASRWEFTGADLQRAQQSEHVPGGYTVPGWQVWKDSKGDTCEKLLAKGRVILMVRSRAVQKARNVLYGNHSRARINNELQGQSVAGQSKNDHGMMTNEFLAAHERDQVSKFPEARLETAPADIVSAEATGPAKVRR